MVWGGASLDPVAAGDHVSSMSAASHLFVYGTLRLGSAAPQARDLAEQASFRGAASVYGRLYRVGSYPGIVLGGGSADWVPGDLFELPRAGDLLERLDDYEGCAPHSLHPHEFARVRTLARSESRVFDVWLYELTRPVEPAWRIAAWPCVAP